MLTVFSYLYISVFITILTFLFFLNFTFYSLISLLVVYLMVFLLFLNLGLSYVGLIMLIIYVGAVLILFLFMLFFYENVKSITHKMSKFRILELLSFIFLVSSLFCIFLPILIHFFPSIWNVKFISKDLTLKYLTLNSEVVGFDPTYYKNISFLLYTDYFICIILLFLIFFVALFVIVVVLSDNYSYLSSSYIITKIKKSNLSVISNFFYSLAIGESKLLFMTVLLSFLILIFISTLSIRNQFKFDFIKFLIFIELAVLSATLSILYFSFFLSDISGIVFIFIIFGIYAVETAIGLLLFSVYTTYKSKY